MKPLFDFIYYVAFLLIWKAPKVSEPTTNIFKIAFQMLGILIREFTDYHILFSTL